MPTKHFVDLPERGRDLWRVTYADPPANWLQQVQIYRERQTGEAWGAIAIRHQCSVAAVQARYRVVAEHLEKLAETEGIVSAATVLCRCPGVRKQVYGALDQWGIRTLGEFARCSADEIKRIPGLGRVGNEELHQLMDEAGLL